MPKVRFSGYIRLIHIPTKLMFLMRSHDIVSPLPSSLPTRPNNMKRRVQAAAVEPDSTRPTSQGVNSILGVLAVTESSKKHTALHPPGGGIELALPTQTHLPCPSFANRHG